MIEKIIKYLAQIILDGLLHAGIIDRLESKLQFMLEQNAIDIKKIEITNNSVIVFYSSRVLSEKAIDNVKLSIKSVFPNNKIMILEEGMKIEAIDEKSEAL